MKKHLIRPDRLRQVPIGFSWVDHRLVRQHYIERCDCIDLALYLFLITVSDAQGLSYYSDQAICRCLRIEPAALTAARVHLQKAELIAYQKPLYQVLSLEQASEGAPSPASARTGQAQSIAQILGRALKGGAA
ncbi:MAG TPA: hypothetical protein VK901_10335 [Nitrospiraceae bacterium]|jgi:hypothetical protein|nr:hypothetical protein [Nitrospiraceae bacterium]